MHKKKHQKTSGAAFLFQPLGHVQRMRPQIWCRAQKAADFKLSDSPLLNVIWTGMKLLEASGELQLCRCCRCWPTYKPEDQFLRHMWTRRSQSINHHLAPKQTKKSPSLVQIRLNSPESQRIFQQSVFREDSERTLRCWSGSGFKETRCGFTLV